MDVGVPGELPCGVVKEVAGFVVVGLVLGAVFGDGGVLVVFVGLIFGGLIAVGGFDAVAGGVVGEGLGRRERLGSRFRVPGSRFVIRRRIVGVGADRSVLLQISF